MANLSETSTLSGLSLSAWTAAWLGLVGSLAGCSGSPRATSAASGQLSPLGNSRQAVLVVSRDWDATGAILQCYDRGGIGQSWEPVGGCVTVNIGRTGLAWGRGLHTGSPLPGPIKREGDGKAPAGVFELPQVFGYAPEDQVPGVKLPYIALASDIVGVDDVKSKYYNQIVNAGLVPLKDWNSAETMRRADGLYEWGVLVNHNTSPTLPGAGSCIFLHVWRGSDSPTAGCTAMSRQEMIRLVTWLDPRAKPLLVQLPHKVSLHLAGIWGLPPCPKIP